MSGDETEDDETAVRQPQDAYVLRVCTPVGHELIDQR
jgi:hypothetical protein